MTRTSAHRSTLAHSCAMVFLGHFIVGLIKPLCVAAAWATRSALVVVCGSDNTQEAHSKKKRYFQGPFLVLQLVTNRGL